MWLPFPISDDIIIQLFLFFTNSFHNPSSIFCIDRGIVSISLLKVVCYQARCYSGCVIIQIVAIMTLESLFSVVWIHFVSKVGVWRRRYRICPTLYIVAMYVHIHFNHVTKALPLPPWPYRYQRSIPLLAHMLQYQTTEDRAKSSHSLCAEPHHDSWRWSPQVGAILWAQKPFCEVVTTAP